MDISKIRNCLKLVRCSKYSWRRSSICGAVYVESIQMTFNAKKVLGVSSFLWQRGLKMKLGRGGLVIEERIL